MNAKIFLPFLILFLTAFGAQAQHRRGHHRPHGIELSGRITSTDHEIIDFASVYLKGTSHGAYVDTGGRYRFRAPAGTYTLTVSAIGYETIEKEITLRRGENFVQDFTLRPDTKELNAVTVTATGVSRVQRSAYNAIATFNKMKDVYQTRLQLERSSRSSLELSQAQYVQGTIGYMDLLDAQRTYLSAQISLSNAVRDRQLALVNVYKALGGGWSDER